MLTGDGTAAARPRPRAARRGRRERRLPAARAFDLPRRRRVQPRGREQSRRRAAAGGLRSRRSLAAPARAHTAHLRGGQRQGRDQQSREADVSHLGGRQGGGSRGRRRDQAAELRATGAGRGLTALKRNREWTQVASYRTDCRQQAKKGGARAAKSPGPGYARAQPPAADPLCAPSLQPTLPAMAGVAADPSRERPLLSPRTLPP